MTDKNLSDIDSLLDAKKELRMVLVGKTGAGKSASGNTILGRKAFKSTPAAFSVTAECQKETGEFEGQTIAVVDTPGLFDTKLLQQVMLREVARCISLSAPGPHVFLIVVQTGRFTEEEQQTVRIIQEVFGEKSGDYTMVLFTCGDDLEADGTTTEKLISENPALRSFIRRCEGRYHVFNNKDKDPCQVRQLLKKINIMVELNGGCYYSNKMFREAQRTIKDEIKRLQTENPKMGLSEVEKQAERENPFIQTVLAVAVSFAIAAVETAKNKVEGPMGDALTAVARALTAAVNKNDVCKIQ